MILPEEAGLESHVLLLYVARADQRDNLLRELRENDIETGIYYLILIDCMRAFLNLRQKDIDFPVSIKQAEEILFL